MVIDEIFDKTSKDPNESLNKRRILAKKKGEEAKYAYLTDYLGFPSQGDHMYDEGKEHLKSNPDQIEKIEHEINFVIYGEKYSKMLAEEKAKNERKRAEYFAKEFYQKGNQISLNYFNDRFTKQNLLKKYFPQRFGENGTAFQNKGTKNNLNEYNDVGIGKLFENVLKKIKEDYKL